MAIRVNMKSDAKNTKNIISYPLASEIYDIFKNSFTAFQYSDPSLFVRKSLTETFLTSKTKLLNYVIFLEDSIANGLKDNPNLERVAVKLRNHQKSDDTYAQFNINIVYRQKYCLTDTVLSFVITCQHD